MGSIIKSNKLRWFILIITPIIFMNFYCYVGFNPNITKLFLFAAAAFLLARYYKEIFFKKFERRSFSRNIQWYILLILITHLTAYFVWGQSISQTFRASAAIFAILYYFILKEFKVNKNDLIKIIAIFAAIYAVLWLFAVSQAPRVVFGLAEELGNDRGFFRVIGLPGLHLLLLFYYYALYKATTVNMKRVLWVSVCIVSLVIIVLSLTRTVIISTLLISAIFLFKRRPKITIMLTIVLFLGGGSLFMNNKVVSSLFELTIDQKDKAGNNELAVRNEEYSLLFELFPPHPVTTIVGNGTPHTESSYGKREEQLKEVYRFHRSDAGYVSLFLTYGVVGVIILFSFLKKAYKTIASEDMLCYKMYIYSFFIVNMTGDSYVKNMIPFVLAIYGLELARTNNKKKIQ